MYGCECAKFSRRIQILCGQTKLEAMKKPVLLSVSFAKTNSGSNSVCEGRKDFSVTVSLAREEIREYITQIWNDNKAREQLLEELQEQLNENLSFLQEQRTVLQEYISAKKGLEEEGTEIFESMEMIRDQMMAVENEINKIRDLYNEANRKGWKIIFYPKLEYNVLKAESQKKGEKLREQERMLQNCYQKLADEENVFCRKMEGLGENIQKCRDAIDAGEAVLEVQKQELSEMKDVIVKGANAYIYYSMLEQKLDEVQEQLILEYDFCDDIEKAMLTQKELESLLNLWNKNQSDRELVYRILQRLFDVSRTECFGKNTGEEFDDSQYVRGYFEVVRGLYIQSGYIVDGIRSVYGKKTNNPFHGGNGGEPTEILFDPEDEVVCVSGRYAVPFMEPGGDAIGDLRIRTKKNREYGPFGECGNRGTPFELKVPEDGHFAGFFGKQKGDGFLTSIGLLYTTDTVPENI